MGRTYTAGDLRGRRTISQGQCCDLRVERSGVRVWLCRVAGGVTVERYDRRAGRWRRTSGGCTALEATD